jgi:uncharacterized protein (DUF433 family)
MAPVQSDPAAPKANDQSRVVSSPGVCGGKPCVAGTRIRVQDVYAWHELQGLSADEIVSNYPQLAMADVYAALSYFWEHRDEILRQIADEESWVAALKARSPSPLAQKLAAAHAKDDPISS